MSFLEPELLAKVGQRENTIGKGKISPTFPLLLGCLTGKYMEIISLHDKFSDNPAAYRTCLVVSVRLMEQRHTI